MKIEMQEFYTEDKERLIFFSFGDFIVPIFPETLLEFVFEETDRNDLDLYGDFEFVVNTES